MVLPWHGGTGLLHNGSTVRLGRTVMLRDGRIVKLSDGRAVLLGRTVLLHDGRIVLLDQDGSSVLLEDG
jgi:hypothetical protein